MRQRFYGLAAVAGAAVLLFAVRAWWVSRAALHQAEIELSELRIVEQNSIDLRGVVLSPLDAQAVSSQVRDVFVARAAKHLREALQWNPASGQARRRMRQLAERTTTPALKLAILRDLRAMTFASRHVWQPHQGDIEILNDEIAGLLNGDDGQKARWRAELRQPEPLRAGWTVAMVLFFLTWLGVTVQMIWKGFAADGSVQMRVLRAHLAVDLALLLAWIACLSQVSAGGAVK